MVVGLDFSIVQAQEARPGKGHIHIAQLQIKNFQNPDLEIAISEYRSENFEEAVALFQKVLEKDPRNSRAYFYLGLIDKQVGKLAEAVKNLQEALRLKPPVLEAYAELIDVFHNLGQFKEARKWVIKAEQAGSEPAKIAFLKGLIALGEDKSWEAVPSFNKAKEIDPSLTQAADFQIAMAQAKGRRLIEARDSLKAVLSKDPNSELAAVAREYERAIGKALAEYRAWRFTVGMGVQYDTNVVLKPSNDVQGVMISNDNDGSITNSFKVDYTPLLKGPWFLNGQYSFNSNTYFTIRNYNMMVQSVSLNPGYNLKNDSFSLPMNYSHVWLKEVPYQGIGTIKPTLTLLPFPNMVNQISLGYGKRNMQQAVSNPDEERSGNVYSGMVNAFQTFAEGRGMISFKYELSKDLTDGRNWENLGNRFTLMLLYPLAQKFYLILSGDLTYQEYDQNHSVFRVKRSDKLYSGSAMLSWELLPQMTMNLQYTFTKANSNIPIYDYARNLSSLECEYRF